MRPVIMLMLILVTTVTPADEPASEKLKAPAGWGGETISLPPGFAKDMTLKGREHIRFAPGMMRAESDTFFCYAFAFELKKGTKLDEAELRREFLTYYRGLCTAVMNGQKPELALSEFTLALEKQPADKAPTALKSQTSYLGKLKWVEPFATKKTQTLNLEITTGNSPEHTVVFACVSPQAADKPIWKQLRKVRTDYLLSKSERKSSQP